MTVSTPIRCSNAGPAASISADTWTKCAFRHAADTWTRRMPRRRDTWNRRAIRGCAIQ